MDVSQIRSHFPILGRRVGGRPVVYFDSAATSQRPDTVTGCLRRINEYTNANIHRAVHTLAGEMTDLYEAGREAARSFINAACREEVILTSGTTAGINLVASILCPTLMRPGDEILISEAEHHSNMIPWMMQARRLGLKISYIPVDDTGHPDMTAYGRCLASGRVRLVAVTHVSNVLGILNPVEEMTAAAHRCGAQILIDGAQGIVHADVDVQAIGCDWYVFSGHKIYAATGTGVLYGRRELLETLPPWMGGGEMVGTVTYGDFTCAPLPLRFEAGTPNFAGGATLAPALAFARQMKSPQVKEHIAKLKTYLQNGLASIEGLHLYGTGEGKAPLFSFTVEGCHHEDLAILLDKMGIAVRSGLMCAEPLVTSRLGLTGVVRVSPAPYNTMEECGYLLNCLEKAIKMLR